MTIPRFTDLRMRIGSDPEIHVDLGEIGMKVVPASLIVLETPTPG